MAARAPRSLKRWWVIPANALSRFFDQILAKYGQPDWTFSSGYPLLDRIILYEQHIEVVTGKRREGPYH